MKTNFFETECKEPARTAILFGICDDDNSSKAYTSVENKNNWIAIIKNDKQKSVSFIAIDNCIEKRAVQKCRLFGLTYLLFK